MRRHARRPLRRRRRCDAPVRRGYRAHACDPQYDGHLPGRRERDPGCGPRDRGARRAGLSSPRSCPGRDGHGLPRLSVYDRQVRHTPRRHGPDNHCDRHGRCRRAGRSGGAGKGRHPRACDRYAYDQADRPRSDPEGGEGDRRDRHGRGTQHPRRSWRRSR